MMSAIVCALGWSAPPHLAAPPPDTTHGTVSLQNGAPARNAVVWFEGSVKSTPRASATVDQRDLTFIPHVSVVTVGTNIRFPNHDTVYHNVFAEFDAKRFDLGMYPRGSSKSVRFDKPGLVAILCSVHSNMSAYVMVVDTPYFAVADSRGRFSISGVPAGPYTLHVWHESGQTHTARVSVPDRGSDWVVTTAR